MSKLLLFPLIIGHLLNSEIGFSQTSTKDKFNNYPILMSFRMSSDNKSDSELKLISSFDLMQIGENGNYDKFLNKNGLIYRSTYSAISKKSPFFNQIWDGHWLYYNGCKVEKDIQIGDTIIYVSNPSLFMFDPSNPSKQDDIVIYTKTKKGDINWDYTEHAKILGINYKEGFLIVKRGYLSSEREFSDKIYVAAHAKTLLSLPGSYNRWGYNISINSPKDKLGRDGAEALADILSTYFKNENVYSGVQFDVGGWLGEHQPSTNIRKSDVDNDLKIDNKYYYQNGIAYPSYGLGVMKFSKLLHQRMGDDFFILGDFNTTSNGWRGYYYGNGIEEEITSVDRPDLGAYSFSNLGSWKFSYYNFIRRRTKSPNLSYILCKGPTELYSRNKEKSKGQNKYFRQLFCVNMLGDGVISYTSAEHENALGFDTLTWWDEYLGGDLKIKGYLGRPKTEAKRYLNYNFNYNILEYFSSVKVTSQSGYRYLVKIEGSKLSTKIKKMPRDLTSINKNGIIIKIPLKESIDNEPYILKMKIKGENYSKLLDSTLISPPLVLSFGLGSISLKSQQFILVDQKLSEIEVTIWPEKKIISNNLYISFGEEAGSVLIEKPILIKGDSFAFYRIFENGLVLMNGTSTTQTFDLNKIDKKNSYKRISGQYTPQVNNGAIITNNEIKLAPYDGLVLLKINKN